MTKFKCKKTHYHNEIMDELSHSFNDKPVIVIVKKGCSVGVSESKISGFFELKTDSSSGDV